MKMMLASPFTLRITQFAQQVNIVVATLLFAFHQQHKFWIKNKSIDSFLCWAIPYRVVYFS